MTDCPDGTTRDLLPDFVHGRLGAAAAARVTAHLAACAACADEVRLLRTVLSAAMATTPALDRARLVGTLPAPPRAGVRPIDAATGRTAGARAGARRGSAGGASAWRWSTWRIAASVATIGIGGLSVVLLQRDGGHAPSAIVDIPTTVATSAASPSSIPAVAPSAVAPSAVAPQAAGSPTVASVEAPEAAPLPAGGGMADLADEEVESLLHDIDNFDGVPDASPQPAVAVPRAGGVL